MNSKLKRASPYKIRNNPNVRAVRHTTQNIPGMNYTKQAGNWVIDYTTGNGRISVGPSDGIIFYNGNAIHDSYLAGTCFIINTGTSKVCNSSATNVIASNS